MDIAFITKLCIPLVTVLCLIIGYVLKRWIKDIHKKYIPTILILVGAVAACLSAKSISLELIVSGAVSGLASTGLHQTFKQIIGDKNKE